MTKCYVAANKIEKEKIALKKKKKNRYINCLIT